MKRDMGVIEVRPERCIGRLRSDMMLKYKEIRPLVRILTS